MKLLPFTGARAALALILAAPVLAADASTRFVTHSENRVTLQGTTSVHD